MNIRAAWAALWAECDWRDAIHDANEWLEICEGVDLLYYANFDDQSSKDLIKRVIG